MNAKFAAIAIPFLCAAWGGDIPGEVQNPCDVHPEYCVQPQFGSPGSISIMTGLGILGGTDTTKPGTLAQPWLINLSSGASPLVLQFQGNVPGGPLRSLTDFNSVGTNHTTGRYFQLTLTNTGSQTWLALALGLTAPPLDLNIDGASFGDSFSNVPPFSNTPCTPVGSPQCLDITKNFSSNRFSQFSVDHTNDILTFSGGQVNPGQSVNLLYGVTIQQYGPGSVTTGFFAGPYLPLLMSVAPTATPEPGTWILALTGGLGWVVLRQRRSRRKS